MSEQFIVRGINGTTTMNAAAYKDYKDGLTSRLAAGRYTLEEAALAIEEGTKEGERAAEMLVKLMAAALAGDLLTYEPGRNARYTYGVEFATRVRYFYEETHWDDLNSWLYKNEPRIKFKFPTPDRKAPATKREEKNAIENRENKIHRGILDPAIGKAISQAGNAECADVWLKLKEIALGSEQPFTGSIAGAALCYTDVNDKPAKLTKEALSARLKRRVTNRR